jgi:hypothetical protein
MEGVLFITATCFAAFLVGWLLAVWIFTWGW